MIKRLFFSLIILLATTYVTYSTPPVYRSTASVMIESTNRAQKIFNYNIWYLCFLYYWTCFINKNKNELLQDIPFFNKTFIIPVLYLFGIIDLDLKLIVVHYFISAFVNLLTVPFKSHGDNLVGCSSHKLFVLVQERCYLFDDLKFVWFRLGIDAHAV